VGSDGGLVGGGAVAFMRREIVAGVGGVVLLEEAIALDLGCNGGEGDGEAFGIALDDALVGPREAGKGTAIDEDCRRGCSDRRGLRPPRSMLRKQGLEGTLHREAGGAEDIVLVNFLGAGLGPSDAEAEAGAIGILEGVEGLVILFAVGLGQLLGVVDRGGEELGGRRGVKEGGITSHRGGDHRAGPGTSAGLIHAHEWPGRRYIGRIRA